jgi:hypothetical protein
MLRSFGSKVNHPLMIIVLARFALHITATTKNNHLSNNNIGSQETKERISWLTLRWKNSRDQYIGENRSKRGNQRSQYMGSNDFDDILPLGIMMFVLGVRHEGNFLVICRFSSSEVKGVKKKEERETQRKTSSLVTKIQCTNEWVRIETQTMKCTLIDRT